MPILTKFIPFGNLFNYQGPLNPNGKVIERTIPGPIDKQGGRFRASMMTDHYEQHFQELQCLGKEIPMDYFHSSKYGDNIMKNVISIHYCEHQLKYVRLPMLAFWSQTETRKQLESYYRETRLNQTARSNDPDIRQMVHWWYDKHFGIKARIERYNASHYTVIQSFIFDPDISILEMSLSKKRKQTIAFEEDDDDDILFKSFTQEEMEEMLKEVCNENPL